MWFLEILNLFFRGASNKGGAKQTWLSVLAMLAILIGTVLFATGFVPLLSDSPAVPPHSPASSMFRQKEERDYVNAQHAHRYALARTVGGAVSVLGGIGLLLGLAFNKVK